MTLFQPWLVLPYAMLFLSIVYRKKDPTIAVFLLLGATMALATGELAIMFITHKH